MIYLGADHAGYKLKEFLKNNFDKRKIKYSDLGTYSEEPVDYPDYAFKVARKVAKEKNAKGILICSTGAGMCIAANRIRGARAVLAYDKYSAKMSKMHNDANILCLKGWNVSFKKQAELVVIWLKTKFENIPRRRRRIAKLK